MDAMLELKTSEARPVDFRTFRLETRIRLAYSGFHRLRLPARRVNTTRREDLLTLLGFSTGVNRKEVSIEEERRCVDGTYETVGIESEELEAKELLIVGDRSSIDEEGSSSKLEETGRMAVELRTKYEDGRL